MRTHGLAAISIIRRQAREARLPASEPDLAHLYLPPYDWTVRPPAIAAAAQRIKAKSVTIDGEAVVLGPDGLSRFDDLRRREAAHCAMLYAFDLVEHDGDDLRGLPFLDRKAALARLLRDIEAGILLKVSRTSAVGLQRSSLFETSDLLALSVTRAPLLRSETKPGMVVA